MHVRRNCEEKSSVEVSQTLLREKFITGITKQCALGSSSSNVKIIYFFVIFKRVLGPKRFWLNAN